MTHQDIIIGSGPAGISTAFARLAKGRKVTLLDVGKDLEADLKKRRDTMAAETPWDQGLVESYQKGQLEGPDGAIRKFGSDYAIEPYDTILTEARIGLRASYARGGLSNLWGASVLPSSAQDITDWPIGADDLAPHYKAVMGFMPVAGRDDIISRLYPVVDMSGSAPIAPTPQAEELLRRADRQKGEIEGVRIGGARNAVSACENCGMCLHGCPWGFIYSAAHSLPQLLKNPDFEYLPEHRVTHIGESAGLVQVIANGRELSGERLFLGAGVLSTAQIVMASFPKHSQLTLKDSEHFFTPMLHHWRTKSDPMRTPHHTLAGVFAELDLAELSTRLVHTQIYTWNEKYALEMQAKYGRGFRALNPLFQAVSKRLIVAQSFLHSDHSSRIHLSMNHDKRLIAKVERNSQTADLTKAARRKLSRAMRKLGVHALGFAGHSGGPGSSFHVGGSLPMGGLTDPLGRIGGTDRIHVVDASVMPTIPASTITFTVMANAHRIGALAP